MFAVEALISRGGEVYDYFFRPGYEKFTEFLNLVVSKYEEDNNNEPNASKYHLYFFIRMIFFRSRKNCGCFGTSSSTT